jgi:excisionase family DNA binding protein
MHEMESGETTCETISVPEAGRRLGLGRNASYEAARRGEMPLLQFGRRKRVPLRALERMLVETRPRMPLDRSDCPDENYDDVPGRS